MDALPIRNQGIHDPPPTSLLRRPDADAWHAHAARARARSRDTSWSWRVSRLCIWCPTSCPRLCHAERPTYLMNRNRKLSACADESRNCKHGGCPDFCPVRTVLHEQLLTWVGSTPSHVHQCLGNTLIEGGVLVEIGVTHNLHVSNAAEDRIKRPVTYRGDHDHAGASHEHTSRSVNKNQCKVQTLQSQSTVHSETTMNPFYPSFHNCTLTLGKLRCQLHNAKNNEHSNGNPT